MKKKITMGIVSLLGIASTSLLGFTTLTSCNKGGDTPEPGPTPPGPEPEPEKGDVFHIAYPSRSGGQEFVEQFKQYMSDERQPGADEYHLNGVPVKFTMLGNGEDYHPYVEWLDENLPNNKTLSEDEKIDLFVAEPEYIYKYVNSDWTNDIANLNLSKADFPRSYEYPLAVCSDADGIIKGACLNFCPSVVFYSRYATKMSIGTDDPSVVQGAIGTWDKFNETADSVKAKGCTMLASYMSTYRSFAGNMDSPWITPTGDGKYKLNVDNNKAINEWLDMTKPQLDKGNIKKLAQWTDEWREQFAPTETTICEFGPKWFYEDLLTEGWAVCLGPQTYDWGGTYALAATDGDNDDEVKATIQMLNDPAILTEISHSTDVGTPFVNHIDVNVKRAEGYQNPKLGGQNDFQVLCEAATRMSYKNVSKYDDPLNELFMEATKYYFEGEITRDDAIAAFKEAVLAEFEDIVL